MSEAEPSTGAGKSSRKQPGLAVPFPLPGPGWDTHGCLVLAHRVGQGQREVGDPWGRFPVPAPGRGMLLPSPCHSQQCLKKQTLGLLCVFH